MADTENQLASEEKNEVPDSRPPSLPSYTSDELQPPPYSAAAVMYPSSKTEPICTTETTPGYPCSTEENPEVPAESPPVEESPSPFEDPNIERAFVRKVFCIVTLMLLFTFSVVCVFTFSQTVKVVVQKHFWIYITSIIVFVITALCLGFCPSFSRRHPWNLVALAVVNITLSYMVGTIASYHDTAAVVFTMASTLIISLSIIIFTVQTRYSLSVCSILLLILCVDLLMFGVYSSFYYHHILDAVYGTLGALIFAVFLALDCQLLMLRTSDRLDPEEYVNAALIIYLDIILIFLYLMGRR